MTIDVKTLTDSKLIQEYRWLERKLKEAAIRSIEVGKLMEEMYENFDPRYSNTCPKIQYIQSYNSKLYGEFSTLCDKEAAFKRELKERKIEGTDTHDYFI